MDFNKFFQSKTFKVVTWAVAGLIVLLLVFRLGVAVGYRKAQFSYRWGENYHLNFGGPREGFLGFMSPDGGGDFISLHGAVGQIIKIDGNTLIVKDGRSNVEKSVLVKDGATILRMRDEAELSDLKVDDFIVVIGDPNDAGQVEARLIRIIPSPPPTGNSASPRFFMKRLPR